MGPLGWSIAPSGPTPPAVFVADDIAGDGNQPAARIVGPNSAELTGHDQERLLREIICCGPVDPSREEAKEGRPKCRQEHIELRCSSRLGDTKQRCRPLRHEPPFG
jgi:hypothetical protein